MPISDQPVIAERSVYWNSRNGGHCASGVVSSASQWYLAEGATDGGFETWVLIQNPNANDVTVDLTLMTDTGPQSPPDLQGFPMAANSRQSFNLGNYVTSFNVSTKVTSQGGDVIAERAMYWQDKLGGHDAHGLEYAKLKAFMAEGATAGGFETWVLLQNPGPSDAMVYITYMTENGAVEKEPFGLAAGQRISLNVVNDVGETYDVSTQVYSTAPVAVERSVYWNGKIGGTCSTGYSAW